MKKLLSLILSFAMIASLTTTVFASATGGNDPADEPYLPDSTATEPSEWVVPDWASNLDMTVKPYGGSFLYWAQLSLDPTPEIVYDTGLDMVFLSYKLDAACKLAECFNHYRTTFLVQYNLQQLIKLNDINTAIWEKPERREKSIGSQLSNKTVTTLKSGEYDAYEAITQVIMKSDEYLADPRLNEQVRYHFSCLNRYKEDIVDGIERCSIYLPRIEEDAAPAEVIAAVQEILDDNPELQVLKEVRALVYEGKTSKTLATFQALGAERCEELWAKISDPTSNILIDECRWLDNYRVVTPLPGAVYNGPVERPASESPYPFGTLPTSATGG